MTERSPSRSLHEQDGRWYELSAWPLLDPSGEAEAFVHIAKDITERRLAEQSLRESEQRYRQLFDNMSIGLAYCRMVYEGELPVDFEYLAVNAAFETLTGLRAVRGKRVSEVIPGILESDPELFEVYGRVASTGASTRFEMLVSSLGQWFDVSAYCPRPGHFVAVFDVITKRKQAEANLLQFSERLEHLAGVVRDLSQARTEETIVQISRVAARALSGADGATFVLREGDLCHYVDEDAIAPLWKGKRFPLTGCISGWSMIHRQSAVIEDVYGDERIAGEVYRPTFVKSLAIVPIRIEAPVGAIGVYWARGHRATADDVRILLALAESVSVALDNVHIMAELERGRARTRAIFDHLPSASLLWQRVNGVWLLADFNEAARVTTKGWIVPLLGSPPASLSHVFPNLQEDLAQCFENRSPVRRETDCKLPETTVPRRMVLTYGFIPPEMVMLHTEDVTELRQVERQLSVSQRLEAVGRLAGGVAHDFNNLLSVIINYADFVAQALRDSDPLKQDATEILKAGNRAASLTRQLLAFSRKQVLQPEILDLNSVIRGIESMLRRLLGEDIHILIKLGESLALVRADPGQIEQVLMNLAVNARDAMPKGGRLTIETANVVLDADFTGRHVSVQPGEHVQLCVSDTGCGMDATTLEHAFEPFYTTKEKGKGTGLGLSTVYGIVKQSGGSIWLYSEIDHGTAFKIYLPRVDAPCTPAAVRSPATDMSGSETVLVVEDEEAVRKLAERILRTAGYHVLSAANGLEALFLSERQAAGIDLLLVDVVMPEMSGREVAERLLKVSPHTRVLFTSGYTDNAIVHHGVLDPGTLFIAKPFSAQDLVRKVRDVLDRK